MRLGNFLRQPIVRASFIVKYLVYLYIKYYKRGNFCLGCNTQLPIQDIEHQHAVVFFFSKGPTLFGGHSARGRKLAFKLCLVVPC